MLCFVCVVTLIVVGTDIGMHENVESTLYNK
jgi:hypothetical protein